MTAFSTLSAYDGLDLASVVTLVRVLGQRDLRSVNEVRRAHSESATGFDGVLRFCAELDIVLEKQGFLVMQPDFAELDESTLRQLVLRRLLDRETRYRDEAFALLRRFEFRKGAPRYESPVPRRAQESHCRNFLMELGVIVGEGGSAYQLSDDSLWVYARVREAIDGIHPDALEDRLEAEKEIGRAAELAVLKLETERLGSAAGKELVHIALTNAAAGYDIRSATVTTPDSLAPRYIEVKAVPKDSYRFYWTRNEIEVARVLRSLYYLYLLPVVDREHFDLEGRKEIRDPYGAVYRNPTAWSVSAEVTVCSLREE